MSQGQLTPQQEALLKLIYDHINQKGGFPDNTWLARKMGISQSGISNLKSRLIANGFLENNEGQFRLAEKALLFLKSGDGVPGHREVFSVYVPLFGEVKAGRANAEELREYTSSLGDYATQTVPIPPQMNMGAKVAVLKVVGDSMTSEGILDGDYVVVELTEDLKYLENKLIAARYLLPEDDVDDIDTVDLSSLPLRGFTLKVFKRTITAPDGTILYYILSRRKVTIEKYPYEIKTRVMRPVGRVLGVYRVSD